MSLAIISLGLYDEKDITVRGLEFVKESEYIYLEYYTSVLHIDKKKLEEFFGKKIILASRTMVEGDDNEILQHAKDSSVAFLVVGDAFSATTHSDLYLRAKELDIQTTVVGNASILTAIGETGLQLYKFGKTTSMVFFEPDWKPQTAYDVIKMNTTNGLHTLCLLDIKVAEPTKQDLANENYVPQQPRFMTIKQGLEQLKEIELERGDNVINTDTKVVGVARLGQPDQIIKFGSIDDVLNFDFGGPLHSLIVCGNLHFHEEDVLALFK
jgi:diphthine synthase